MAPIVASKQFTKGRPKNFLEEAHIVAIADAYLKWSPVEGFSAIVTTAQVAANEYNLSPSRYVSVGGEAELLPLDEAIVELQEAEEELDVANRALQRALRELGLSNR